MLERADVHVPDTFRGGRRLVVEDDASDVTLVLARHRDLPQLLSCRHIDVAIGAVVWFLDDSRENIECVSTLDIGHCRLSLLTVSGDRNVSPQRVCTRFVHLTQRLVPNTSIVELHGCNEIALALGTADAVVDVVETGQTIREMDLRETRVLAGLQHTIWTRSADRRAIDLATRLAGHGSELKAVSMP